MHLIPIILFGYDLPEVFRRDRFEYYYLYPTSTWQYKTLMARNQLSQCGESGESDVDMVIEYC